MSVNLADVSPDDDVEYGSRVAAAGAEDQLYTGQAPALARLLVVTVFFGLCVVAFLTLLSMPLGVWQIILSVGYMLALLLLQLLYFGTYRRRSRTSCWFLLIQTALVYLPLLQFKQAWVGMPGFLAGSVLLTLRPKLAWSLFTTIVASMAAVQAVFTSAVDDTVYTAVSTMITGLVVYGLSWLSNLVVAMHAARNALMEQRTRFSRDLHDLLGYGLSAITLKSELTRRLVVTQPDQAQQELSDILAIARQALSDVRTVASGYRELSVAEEARSVRSVLAAADIDVSVQLCHAELPVQVRNVLTTVLREGATNVLRHSAARTCEIEVCEMGGVVTADIVNDGLGDEPAERQPLTGSGLRNLAARVRMLNGQLTYGVDVDGRFRLRATVPLSD